MMTTSHKAIRCPQCGAKNAAGTHRCRTCTRPLDTAPDTSNAHFEDDLWSEPVSRRVVRKPFNKLFLLPVLVIGLGVANYFSFHEGPAWLHEPDEVPKGAQWTTYASPDSVYRIAMPGDPVASTVNTPYGVMAVAQSWVDTNWDLVRDRHTKSIGAIDYARHHLYAAVTIASLAEPTDPATAAGPLVTSLSPPMTVTSPTTDEVKFPSVGRQWNVSGSFTNWPDQFGRGTVRARVVVVRGHAVVIAVFYTGTPDPALLDRVVNDYLSAQAPE